MVTRTTPYNSRFAKAGVSCFYDSEVLNSSFVHLMKFRAKNPRLRKAANRQAVKKALLIKLHLYQMPLISISALCGSLDFKLLNLFVKNKRA